MCPCVGKIETTLPFTMRELDRLSTMAQDTEKRTGLLNSWMDEVDVVLKELVDDVNPNKIELFHQRLFEQTLVIPIQVPQGRPGQLETKFIDLRQPVVDLSADTIPSMGLLELLESVSMNRCVQVLSFRISSTLCEKTTNAVFATLDRTLGSNYTLKSLMIGIEEPSNVHLATLKTLLDAIRTRHRSLKSFQLYIPQDTPLRQSIQKMVGPGEHSNGQCELTCNDIKDFSGTMFSLHSKPILSQLSQLNSSSNGFSTAPRS
jgi:hypothetical protein